MRDDFLKKWKGGGGVVKHLFADKDFSVQLRAMKTTCYVDRVVSIFHVHST